MSIQNLSLKNLFINLLILGLLFLGISMEAKAQAPYFDMATFKEIIEGAQGEKKAATESVQSQTKRYYEGTNEEDAVPIELPPDDEVPNTPDQEALIAATAARLRDFLTSTNFAFNDQLSNSILRNGQLYVEAFRETKIKFQIGHSNYSQIVDPKFRLDLVPNMNFLKALMRVHSAALKDIEESAPKTIDVMAYTDRNESSYAAILYHHCIQAAAVGVNHADCVKDFDIKLSKDRAAIAKFERAYMITYRISRLVFAKFHPEIKLLGDPNILFSSAFRRQSSKGYCTYNRDRVCERIYTTSSTRWDFRV